MGGAMIPSEDELQKPGGRFQMEPSFDMNAG